MMRFFPILCAMLASLFLAACSSYQPAPAAFHASLGKPYLLDSGDQIRVTVFGQEGLTNT